MVVSDALHFLFEYQLNLPGIETLITIRFYRDPTDRVRFSQSHFIHTPPQMDPYETDARLRDTEEQALRQVVSAFCRFYQEAVKAGHQPSESWLKANENFPDDLY